MSLWLVCFPPLTGSLMLMLVLFFAWASTPVSASSTALVVPLRARRELLSSIVAIVAICFPFFLLLLLLPEPLPSPRCVLAAAAAALVVVVAFFPPLLPLLPFAGWIFRIAVGF